MEEKRLAWLDALRALAVMFVVLGHVMEKNEIGQELCGVIYRFHMPLFFTMSGITHELFGGGQGNKRKNCKAMCQSTCASHGIYNIRGFSFSWE